MSALQRINELKQQREELLQQQNKLSEDKSLVQSALQRFNQQLGDRSGALRSLQERRAGLQERLPGLEVEARQAFEGTRGNPLLREAQVAQRLAAERGRIGGVNDLIEREGLGRQQLVGEAQGLIDSEVQRRAEELAARQNALSNLMNEIQLQAQVENQTRGPVQPPKSPLDQMIEELTMKELEKMLNGEQVDPYAELDAIAAEVTTPSLVPTPPQSNILSGRTGPGGIPIGTRNGNMVMTAQGWVDRNSLR